MKTILLLSVATLLFTGCDRTNELKMQTLEARVRNLESAQKLNEVDIEFLREMDSSNAAILTSQQNTLGSLLNAGRNNTDVLKRHDDWINAVTNRSPARR